MSKTAITKQFDARIKKGTAAVFHLTCIKDGSVVPFYDEGPFPVKENGEENPTWRSDTPTGRRQNIFRQLAKRDDEGYPIWAYAHRDAKGAIVPIGPLVDKKTGQVKTGPGGIPLVGADGVEVEVPAGPWHPTLQNPMPIPVVNTQWLERHRHHLGERTRMLEGGAMVLGAEVKRLDEENKKAGGRILADTGPAT